MTLGTTRSSTCRSRRRSARADPALEDVARSLGLGRAGDLLARDAARRSGRRCSAAACSSRCTCSPSSARSRSCASRRSRPRSTPSSRSASTRQPPRRCRSCSSAARCWSSAARRRRGAARHARRQRRAPPRVPLRLGRRAAAGACRAGRTARRSRSASRVRRSSTGSRREPRRRSRRPRSVGATDHDAPASPRPRCSPSRALPVALLVGGTDGPASRLLERSTYIVQALPGIVVALAFVYFTVRYLPRSTSRRPSWSRLRDHVLPARARRGPRPASRRHRRGSRRSPARSAIGRLRAFLRITLPLLAPGRRRLLARLPARVTELTATLVLHPTGSETLATRFWAYTHSFVLRRRGARTPPLLVAISLPACCWALVRATLDGDGAR